VRGSNQATIRPPSIGPGALVALVAPASPFDRAVLFPGLAWLRTRYRVRASAHVLDRDGYLAGNDERRTKELAAAMSDPDVDAIYCARGGYGAMRILDDLPWRAFVERPKWLVGFSDVTALHVEANARGIATIHAPNVTGLGASAITPSERLALIHALEGRPQPAWRGLEIIRAGSARGLLAGGNLALVAAMASANRLVVPEGAILALEDITEKPYRVDRMLTSLLLGGHLSRASAIVFGGFTQCDTGPDGVTVEHVLRDRTASLTVPVVAGAPFGHGSPNRPFVLGTEASLEGDVLSFT
jgi:muramoyltetrapeptide carboxypeptidase